MSEVKRTERGWAGHFCCADQCLFRRNTLLQLDETYVVVSTVGNMISKISFTVEQVGYRRYYETMVFYSVAEDNEYHDADVQRQIRIDGKWCIEQPGKDNEANDMHEAVVQEITERMITGNLERKVEE